MHLTSLFFTNCFKKGIFCPSYFFLNVVAFSLLPLSLPNIVFASSNNFVKTRKTRMESRRVFDSLKHYHDLLAFFIFFFKVPPFFLQKLYSHPSFPFILTQFSFAVYVMVFFPLIINLLFTFFFSLGFSSCSLQICSPCSQVGDDLRCGSVGTSPTSCVRGSKDLQGSLWLPCITSVAEVGRKSCWVHPTASVSFPYTSFLFPASRSKHSCP